MQQFGSSSAGGNKELASRLALLQTRASELPAVDIDPLAVLARRTRLKHLEATLIAEAAASPEVMEARAAADEAQGTIGAPTRDAACKVALTAGLKRLKARCPEFACDGSAESKAVHETDRQWKLRLKEQGLFGGEKIGVCDLLAAAIDYLTGARPDGEEWKYGPLPEPAPPSCGLILLHTTLTRALFVCLELQN